MLATLSTVWTIGNSVNSRANPRPMTVIISGKPSITPSMCGIERRKPKRVPDDSSIRLFGPGVIEATKANRVRAASASSMVAL